MKKDTIYTFRMNQQVKDALQQAAYKDHRSMASLMDKILADYLEKEGLLKVPGLVNDRRRFMRKTISMPVIATWNEGRAKKSYSETLLNISEGGILIAFSRETEIPIRSANGLAPFRLCLGPKATRDALWFDCKAKHLADDGTDIRIGGAFGNLSKNHIDQLNRYAA